MMRAVIGTFVIVVVVAVVFLGLALGRRIDDDTTVDARPTTTTSTTVASNGPPSTLPDNFGQFVAGTRHKPRPRARTAPASTNGHPCGGDLPPCWVMMRESGGDIHAYNPTGCGGRGCRGKWQCDPKTCSGTGSEEQQDAEARALWDHGRGCAHWSACGNA